MGDGSFPNKRPSVPPEEVPPPPEASAGARVIDFPTEDLSASAPSLTTPVPTGTWADEGAERESSVDQLLRPAGVGAWAGGEVVAFPRQPVTRKRPASPSNTRGTGAEEPTGSVEAESVEAESVEAGSVEAGSVEAGSVEAGSVEAGSVEAGSGETGSGEPGSQARPGSDPGDHGRRSEGGDISGTQTTHTATESGREEVERPKYLASELLARDWTPKAPLRRTLRWGAIVVGGLGVVGMLTLGALAPEALGLTVLFALCAATGIAPLSPTTRGSALATVGAAGAVAVGYLGHVTTQQAGTPLLIGCITLTASGLFFRGAHNRSRLARVLVGVGLIATAAWLMLTGGIDAIVVQSLDWQAWIQPVSRLLLGLIAVLTLLTFLDPTSHGGAWVAGFTLLAWLVLDGAGGGLLTVFPLRSPALDPAEAEWTVRAALPLFATMAAGGLCQVWVTLSGMAARRAKAARPTA